MCCRRNKRNVAVSQKVGVEVVTSGCAKVIDLPQHVYRFLLLAAISSNFPHVDVIQHVKQCMKMQREAKQIYTLWKVNGTNTMTCKKHVKIRYLCTHATQHTPHGPHTVSSLLFSSHIHLFRNHGTEKYYPVVCFFLVGRCCGLCAVGRLLVVCLLYVCCVSLDWLVGCHSRTRMRIVSCVFTFTKKKAMHTFGIVAEQRQKES